MQSKATMYFRSALDCGWLLRQYMHVQPTTVYRHSLHSQCTETKRNGKKWWKRQTNVNTKKTPWNRNYSNEEREGERDKERERPTKDLKCVKFSDLHTIWCATVFRCIEYYGLEWIMHRLPHTNTYTDTDTLILIRFYAIAQFTFQILSERWVKPVSRSTQFWSKSMHLLRVHFTFIYILCTWYGSFVVCSHQYTKLSFDFYFQPSKSERDNKANGLLLLLLLLWWLICCFIHLKECTLNTHSVLNEYNFFLVLKSQLGPIRI